MAILAWFGVWKGWISAAADRIRPDLSISIGGGDTNQPTNSDRRAQFALLHCLAPRVHHHSPA